MMMGLAGAAKFGFWLILAAIAVLSLLPLQYAVQSGASDKIEHFIAYAALTACGRVGFAGRIAPLRLATALVGYGITIEIAQYFIPGRMMSGLDILANTLGVLIGLGLAFLTLKVVPSDP